MVHREITDSVFTGAGETVSWQQRGQVKDEKACKESENIEGEIVNVLDPSCARPSHLPSGFPWTRMMSTGSPCFRARSVLLPLQSVRTFPC